MEILNVHLFQKLFPSLILTNEAVHKRFPAAIPVLKRVALVTPGWDQEDMSDIINNRDTNDQIKGPRYSLVYN